MSEHTGNNPKVRFTVQQFIEDMITRLHPDPHEAQELLDAITASLKDRYGEEVVGDALHEAWRFRGALDDVAKDLGTSVEDEAVDTYRALQEH